MLHTLIQKNSVRDRGGGGSDNVFKSIRRALDASSNVLLNNVLLMSTITVRDIICISYYISLEEVKIVHFQH